MPAYAFLEQNWSTASKPTKCCHGLLQTSEPVGAGSRPFGALGAGWPAGILRVCDRLGWRQGVSMIDFGCRLSTFGAAVSAPACAARCPGSWGGRTDPACACRTFASGPVVGAHGMRGVRAHGRGVLGPVAAAITLARRSFRSSRRPGGTRTCAVPPAGLEPARCPRRDSNLRGAPGRIRHRWEPR
jgi:hypothetical protein